MFEPQQPPTILPVIASEDYDAFRHTLRSHIPNTYDEWLNLLAKWEKHWNSDGAPIRHVDVNPDKFARYLGTTGHAPTLNELFVFAALANENGN